MVGGLQTTTYPLESIWEPLNWRFASIASKPSTKINAVKRRWCGHLGSSWMKVTQAAEICMNAGTFSSGLNKHTRVFVFFKWIKDHMFDNWHVCFWSCIFWYLVLTCCRPWQSGCQVLVLAEFIPSLHKIRDTLHWILRACAYKNLKSHWWKRPRLSYFTIY